MKINYNIMYKNNCDFKNVKLFFLCITFKKKFNLLFIITDKLKTLILFKKK